MLQSMGSQKSDTTEQLNQTTVDSALATAGPFCGGRVPVLATQELPAANTAGLQLMPCDSSFLTSG